MAVVAEPASSTGSRSSTPEQRAAATHTGGPLLILAGAGTGKTTTLCARVAWLVSEGVPSERILLLTFTRRASREMLQRARGLVPASSRVLGGTFHSVAHRLVRRHAAALGLPGGFGVLDAGDAADVLDLLREEAGHAKARGTRFPKKGTLLDIYSRTVNAQAPLSGVIAEHFPWVEDHREAISSLFRDYTARKKALGVIDLDDLLLMWRALARDEVIGPRLAASFDHVLIDEYQDVNGLQVDLARALGGFGCAVTAVGDDFQAIYGFRSASAGAHPRLSRRTSRAREWSPWSATTAPPSPCSTRRTRVAAQADASVPEAPARRAPGRRPAAAWCTSATRARRPRRWRTGSWRPASKGSDLRAQAVLARTSHDSDQLELELTRRRIPYVKYGGLKYLEAAHVKDFVALLRLADNGADDVAWFRVLQLVEGLGPASARKAMAVMAGTPRTLAEAPRDEAGEGRLAAVPDRLAAWYEAREVDPLAARERARTR